jgi:chemotaxis signal transduction protein
VLALNRQDLLIVQVVGRHLALPLDAVHEIVAVPLLIAPPNSARFVEGFFDYRGAAVPVVRLDRLFDLPEERLGVYAPLVMLRTERLPLALHVARSVAITSRRFHEIRLIDSAESCQGLVSGQFLFGGHTAYLVTVEQLLLERERRTIAAHQALIASRLGQLAKPTDVA